MATKTEETAQALELLKRAAALLAHAKAEKMAQDMLSDTIDHVEYLVEHGDSDD